jgi:hypothetical protein
MEAVVHRLRIGRTVVDRQLNRWSASHRRPPPIYQEGVKGDSLWLPANSLCRGVAGGPGTHDRFCVMRQISALSRGALPRLLHPFGRPAHVVSLQLH